MSSGSPAPLFVGDNFEQSCSSPPPLVADDSEDSYSILSLPIDDTFGEYTSVSSLRLGDGFEEPDSIYLSLGDDSEEPGSISPFLPGDGHPSSDLQSDSLGDYKDVPLVFEGAVSELEAAKDSDSQPYCIGSNCEADLEHFINNSRQVQLTSNLS
jgi:hypothetical protein